jgi:hypothetical protein
MSIRKKFLKALQNLWKQILQLSRSITQRLKNWLLRSWLVLGRRSRFSSAGFVLPTVVMVILVVILVTTAMVYRSFDRAKNASNVRVNQKVLAATSPAIDRAQAKINALLADPTLPRGTPTDQAMYQAMTRTLNKYTLGDETPLRLAFDIDKNGSIEKTDANGLDKLETLTTAWRFGVDTDNNGKYDSYILYGLYFRNPSPGANRGRSPLEARAIPMDDSQNGNLCGAGTAASLVGNSGWYKTSDGNLKRSFFVFAVTVPITKPQPRLNEEPYSGNKGFAALEFQQDLSRIPLTNNAVVYDDDLEIAPGAGITLNGRIMTNGNLLIGQATKPVQFYQVSSINSCFYSEENAKITVGGNVVLGSAGSTSSFSPVTVHLFESGQKPTAVSFKSNNASVTNPAVETSYNSEAYAKRIDYLVKRTRTPYPEEVKEAIAKNGGDEGKALQDYYKDRTRRVPFKEVPQGADPIRGAVSPLGQGTNNMRAGNPAWLYPADPDTGAVLNNLTLVKTQPEANDPDRRNPDKEDKVGDRILVGNGLPAKWWDNKDKRFIDFYNQYPQPVDGNNNQVTKWNGPPDTDSYRTRMTHVVPLADIGDTTRNGFWERKAAAPPAQQLDGVGGLRVVTGAGIYYHDLNPTGQSFLPVANPPALPTPRATVVKNDPSTEADETKFLNTPTATTIVLPDSMPMWEDRTPNPILRQPPLREPNDKVDDPLIEGRGDLVMRATAVYHYKSSNYPDPPPTTGRLAPYQTPIACVSSYYDPSTPTTARNRLGLPNIELRATNNRRLSGLPVVKAGDKPGLSNNGVSYRAPRTTAAGISGVAYNRSTGLFTVAARAADPAVSSVAIRDRLAYQANLIFPNGRFVNEPLRQALIKVSGRLRLNLADQAAIDSTLCAIQIADRSLGAPTDTVIPHGAIYETAFLDARQVKALDETPIVTADYNLSVEERQPLEIRATVIDLDLLRQKEAGGSTRIVPAPEYLLPDSGIIYATRDDALRDLSVVPPTTGTAEERMATREINSPVDFRLDPTRRPNGIMLINGSILARGNTSNRWKQTEKGLILASNLPVYVKADKKGFNLHQTPGGAPLEEFTTQLTTNPTWNDADFYTARTTAEKKFACRTNQPGLPGCTPGDLWRSATVIADSVTLLSNNFRFGFRNEGDYDLRKNVESLDNTLVLGGYDWDGDGATTGTVTIDENNFGLDLNNNGRATDTTISVKEEKIPVTLARRINGFFDNNYLTSADWFNISGANANFPKDYDVSGGTTYQGSSYVNNFVTPIQRRTNFPEYVMEMCQKRLVEECGPNDWWVYVDGERKKASEIVGENLAKLQGETASRPFPNGKPGAGTTAQRPGRPVDRLYPRRVAFKRDTATNKLILEPPNKTPIALGINDDRNPKVAEFPYSSSSTTRPRLADNALWFKTSSNRTDPTRDDNYGASSPLFYKIPIESDPSNPALAKTTQQPLLVPVLQIQAPEGTPSDTGTFNNILVPNAEASSDKNWMQRPTEAKTTFNLVMAVGDSPTRPTGYSGAPVPEFNGGMPNLPVFLEDWERRRNGNPNPAVSSISGSFIQIKRSAYATAPFLSILNTNSGRGGGIFGYPQAYASATSQGRSPYYYAPTRQWGFDVALLSQLPDLFSQQITTPSAGEPNKFYREVSQDDPWAKTLLCAAAAQTPGTTNYRNYAVDDAKLRPNNCPRLPY